MSGPVSVPVRQCKICRARKPKPELTRWVKASQGWFKDESGRAEGRGTYTCGPQCEQKLLTGKKR